MNLKTILSYGLLLACSYLNAQTDKSASVIQQEIISQFKADGSLHQSDTITYNREGQAIEKRSLFKGQTGTIKITYEYADDGKTTIEKHYFIAGGSTKAVELGERKQTKQPSEDKNVEIVDEVFTTTSELISDYYDEYVGDVVLFFDVSCDKRIPFEKVLPETALLIKGNPDIIKRYITIQKKKTKDGLHTADLEYFMNKKTENFELTRANLYMTDDTGEAFMYRCDIDNMFCANWKNALNQKGKVTKGMSVGPYSRGYEKFHTYEYDDRGNWIKETVTNKKETVIKTITRSLSYF